MLRGSGNMIKIMVCEKVCIGVDMQLNHAEILTAFRAKLVSSETKLDIDIVPHKNGYALYVYASDREFIEYINKDELLFKLCIAIEDVIISKLCENISVYAVIHSGCIKVHNSNMLIVGRKESGKSTLISYLSTKTDFEYICDDSTILTSDSCLGAQIPIRLRNIFVDGINICNINNKSSDGINMRYLFVPTNNPLCMEAKPTCIIFPQYADYNRPSMHRINAIDAFKMLIENSKAWSSPRDLYYIARVYALSIPAYVLKYDNIERAHLMIEKINSDAYEQ